MHESQNKDFWGEFCRNHLERAVTQSFSKLISLDLSQHVVNLLQARGAGTGRPPETTYKGKAIPQANPVLFRKTERIHTKLYLKFFSVTKILEKKEPLKS